MFPVEGTNILDLEVLPQTTSTNSLQNELSSAESKKSNLGSTKADQGIVPPAQTIDLKSAQHGQSGAHPMPTSQPHAKPFVDPAIVSFGKPSENFRHGIQEIMPGMPALPLPQEMLVEVSERIPAFAMPKIPSKPLTPPGLPQPSSSLEPVVVKRTESIASATLSGPFNDLSLNGQIEEAGVSDVAIIEGLKGGKENVVPRQELSQPQETASKQIGKRSRRGGKGKGSRDTARKIIDSQQPEDINRSTAVYLKHKDDAKAKGWRQTPLTEETGPAATPPRGAGGHLLPPEASSRRRRTRRERDMANEERNGWATEEATDIQDMGDFDFEGNLSKFNKREIFDQIRHDDTTADEERLVHYNRVPARLGTNGGKNLHYTENVLDSPRPNGHREWSSESGETEDSLHGKIDSGRSSKRNASRAATRNPPSRKESTIVADKEPGIEPLSKSRVSSFTHTGSPKPKQNASTSPHTSSFTSSKPSFRIVPSNKLCPCVSPLQMLELEQLAVSELGLTEEMMTENVARSVAEVTFRKIQDLERRSGKSNHRSPPLVTVLAGNHKSGARAIAGGRHLQNHGVKVITCVLGLEREDDLLESVRRQTNVYRKCGGVLTKPNELLDAMKESRIQPLLVVDALLGMHMSFHELRKNDQAVSFEFIRWINRNGLDVLSIDVPSGLDASSGEALLFSALIVALLTCLLTPNPRRANHRRQQTPHLLLFHRPLPRRSQNRPPHLGQKFVK